MDASTYTTPELLKVAGLTDTNFRALVGGGFIKPSGGRPGSGVALRHTRLDVLQARFVVVLRKVGVPLHRCAMFWPLVEARLDEPRFLIIAHRDDDSDTDFQFLREDEDSGWGQDDAPACAAVVNVGKLAREVAGRLMALRAAP